MKAKNRIDQFVVGKEARLKDSTTMSTPTGSMSVAKKHAQNRHGGSQRSSNNDKSVGTLKAMLLSNHHTADISKPLHGTTLAKSSEWMPPVRPDQVDQTVLAELPRDIQLELQRQAGRVNLSRTTAARKPPKGIGRWFSSANKNTTGGDASTTQQVKDSASKESRERRNQPKRKITQVETRHTMELPVRKYPSAAACDTASGQKQSQCVATRFFSAQNFKPQATSLSTSNSQRLNADRKDVRGRNDIQWEQVDSSVFLQLPKAIQAEIRRSLRRP